MRVLHVETGRHRYGGARQVLHLMQGLTKHGITNVLLCEKNAAIAQDAQALPIAVLERPRTATPALIYYVRQAVRQHNIDIVHLHSRRGADDFGAIGARLSGARVVVSRRVDNHQPPWLLAMKRPLYNRVIAISKAIRRVLLTDGMPRQRVACVSSAIDLSQYAPPADSTAIRRAFDLPDDSRIVAMVAQFIERKGHRTLVEAMPAIIEAHPKTRFVLFGLGPLQTDTEAFVKEKGLAGHVVFTGFRSDLTSLLPGVDVLAHPAYREGLGIALLEAAAQGVPIVAGRAGGIPEIVKDGQTGRLIPPGDADALADAINALLNDPRQRYNYAQQSRAHIATRFSIDAMVEGNLRVYRRVNGPE